MTEKFGEVVSTLRIPTSGTDFGSRRKERKAHDISLKSPLVMTKEHLSRRRSAKILHPLITRALQPKSSFSATSTVAETLIDTGHRRQVSSAPIV